MDYTLHAIDDYIFDSERLILYKSEENLSKLILKECNCTNGEKFNETLHEISNKVNTNRIAINVIGICLTYNCNLRCNYCGFSSVDGDQHKLQLDDIKAFVDDALIKRTVKKLITQKEEPLIVYFSGGGEPTYEWNLLKSSVQYIKEQCIKNNIPLKLSMTTNGVLSNEEIDFIASNFTRLMISYDGIPDVHDRNRASLNQKSTSIIVERTIRELSIRKIPLEIRTTIWPNDYSKMVQMYEHVFSIACKDDNVVWSLYPVLYEGRAIAHMRQLDNKHYKSFLSYYFDLIEYINFTQGEEKARKIYCPVFSDETISFFCGSLFGEEPCLLPDGSIVTCNEAREQRVYIGKVENHKVIYYNKCYNVFYDTAEKKLLECRNCIAYRFCKGGCPIWHLRGYEDKEGPLECQITRDYWRHILECAIKQKYSFGWRLRKIKLSSAENKEIYALEKEEN